MWECFLYGVEKLELDALFFLIHQCKKNTKREKGGVYFRHHSRGQFCFWISVSREISLIREDYKSRLGFCENLVSGIYLVNNRIKLNFSQPKLSTIQGPTVFDYIILQKKPKRQEVEGHPATSSILRIFFLRYSVVLVLMAKLLFWYSTYHDPHTTSRTTESGKNYENKLNKF